MFYLILFTLVALLIIAGLYQLLIQKYYWGPKGPPGKQDRKNGSSHK